MRKAVVVMIALGVVAATAAAQDVEQRPEQQVWRRGPWRQGRFLSRIVERMAEELSLDDEQLARVNEIVAAQRQRMQELRAQWRQVREAIAAGDQERAAELRAQLREQFGRQGGPLGSFLDEIEPLLHEDQLEAFEQMRRRISRHRGAGHRGRMRQMIRELPEAVSMTAAQREQFQQLLAARREAMRARMREHWQRAERGELPAAGEHHGPPDFAAMQDEFFKQIAGILNQDQLKLLDEYRARLEAAGRRGGRQRGDDLRAVLSAARRIRSLSAEQKGALRDIARAALKSSRELGGDREQLALLAAETKAQIARLLDKQQLEEFNQNLQRLKAHGRRGRHRARGQREGEGRGGERAEKPDRPSKP